jgi:hypothetical protein
MGENQSPLGGSMNRLLMEAKTASRDFARCRETIETLEAMGFGEDAFRRLHHQHDSMENFCNYGEGKRFNDDKNNHRVHQRLRYVLLSCPNGVLPKGMSFESLADEAFDLIPSV